MGCDVLITNNLKDLESYLLKQVKRSLIVNDDVRHAVGKKVSEKVDSEVYDKYSPTSYKRRGHNDGLADERNVEMTGVSSSNNKIQLVYENLTEGNDSMKGQFISDGINDGDEDMWNNPNGDWSKPRPFIGKAINELQNGNELRSALKSSLQKSGLEVK